MDQTIIFTGCVCILYFLCSISNSMYVCRIMAALIVSALLLALVTQCEFIKRSYPKLSLYVLSK